MVEATMLAERAEGGVRASRAAGYQTLFVVGCPRSGTTWVQLLLDRFEGVATAPETQIFAYYLEQFRRQWRHEHEGPGRAHQGQAGLSRLLTESEFEELCRGCARAVLEKIAARRPGARVVVEKSPKHALQAEFIHRLFPDAYFLHVIRDPRDTAASLLAAARGWGRGWAPANAIEAARMWRSHVCAARAVAARTDRYREVRYEALRAQPVEELAGIVAWLGLDADRERCEAAVRACDLGRLQQERSGRTLPLPGERSPRDFFRRGVVGGWRDDLSRTDLRIVERVCGAVMEEAGYARVTRRWAPGLLRIPLHDAVQRARESIDWQLQRLLRVV